MKVPHNHCRCQGFDMYIICMNTLIYLSIHNTVMMSMARKHEEILPETYRRETFHRITVRSKVFDMLGEVRRKNRLWDRESAIIWLLQQQGLWQEEEEAKWMDKWIARGIIIVLVAYGIYIALQYFQYLQCVSDYEKILGTRSAEIMCRQLYWEQHVLFFFPTQRLDKTLIRPKWVINAFGVRRTLILISDAWEFHPISINDNVT